MRYFSSSILLSLLIAFTLATFQDCNADKEVTSIYLVRHADRDGRPDVLNDAGVKRAQDLKELLKNVKFDAVFSSDYNRTKSTAKPLIDELGISLTIYDAANIPGLVENIKTNYLGKKILIVGHSNTVPETINEFGVTPALEHIDHDTYNNLFLVRFATKGTAELIQQTYGE